MPHGQSESVGFLTYFIKKKRKTKIIEKEKKEMSSVPQFKERFKVIQLITSHSHRRLSQRW